MTSSPFLREEQAAAGVSFSTFDATLAGLARASVAKVRRLAKRSRQCDGYAENPMYFARVELRAATRAGGARVGRGYLPTECAAVPAGRE